MKFFILFTSIILIISCNDESRQISTKTKIISLPDGIELTTFILENEREHTQGLSGVKKSEFKESYAALFLYKDCALRRFWMINTYFDLDIFFLDKDFKVIQVERNMKAFPGKVATSKIPQTKTIFACHVLEMKASSPLAKKIKVGTILK